MTNTDKQSRYQWLYETYGNDLFSYGQAFGVGKEELEDTIHDVFIHLYEHDHRLWESDNVKAYLLNCLKNRIRMKKRKRDVPGHFSDKYEEASDFLIEVNGFELLESEQERSEQIRILQEMLDSLTPRQREAIYLRYTQGLSYKEIAQLMHIQSTAAQKLVYRAINDMRCLHPKMIFVLLLYLIPLFSTSKTTEENDWPSGIIRSERLEEYVRLRTPNVN